MEIIGLTYPDSVRLLIGVDITEKELPKAVIDNEVYAGVAIAWAKKTDAQWESRTGAQLDSLRRGAIFYLAALLIRAMPILIQENYGGGEGYTRQQVKVQERVAELEALALAQISSYLEPEGYDSVVSMPTSFAIAPGRRGY